MGNAEETSGQQSNKSGKKDSVQSQHFMQNANASSSPSLTMSMQAPMGPQGGTSTPQAMSMSSPNSNQQSAQNQANIPANMMTGPQEWEWLTMSL